MMFVLDVHKAQKMDAFQSLLRGKCKTKQLFVYSSWYSTTHFVQPVEVVFDAPFKQAVKKEATKHFHNNLVKYTRGLINASECCVLFTELVRNEVSANADMVMDISSYWWVRRL